MDGMKTPNPNEQEEWIKWNGKASDTVRFAQTTQKRAAITTSQALIKKADLEKMRAARAQERAAKASDQETTSNTQRIDVCFDSLWRKCT
jgi:hypothetical protein